METGSTTLINVVLGDKNHVTNTIAVDLTLILDKLNKIEQHMQLFISENKKEEIKPGLARNKIAPKRQVLE